MARLPALPHRVELARHRARLRLTHAQVAQRLTELAEQHEGVSVGIDAQLVSKHERGVSRPQPLYRRQYERLYGAPEAELWVVLTATAAAPAVASTTPQRIDAAPTADPAGFERDTVENMPYERTLVAMAARRARSFTLLTAEGASVQVIDVLREDLQNLATAYPRRPLLEILDQLVEVQDSLFALLERRQPLARARELYFLTGVVSGMLAKASHDLSQPRAALLQVRTALLAAGEVGHPGLSAWLRGLQSQVAYWSGRFTEAVHYAELGREQAGRGRGRTRGWLPASAARAHAALGDGERAVAMIEEAESSWDSGADELDDLGGICTFNRSRNTYYVADALAWLPTTGAAAAQYALHAVDAFNDRSQPDWAFGDMAGSHCDLAIARLRAGEQDGATEALAPVLDMPTEERIKGVVDSVQRVHDVARVIPAGRSSRELAASIEEFRRSPLTAVAG